MYNGLGKRSIGGEFVRLGAFARRENFVSHSLYSLII